MKKFVAAAACVAFVSGAGSVSATELVGAVQFDENHAFTKALREFERVAGECSGGRGAYTTSEPRSGAAAVGPALRGSGNRVAQTP